MTDEQETPVAVADVKAAKVAKVLSDDQQALADHDRMRNYFAAQKKVSIKTREDEWVQINDYVFIIKANERVEVPEDVATLLEQSGRI